MRALGLLLLGAGGGLIAGFQVGQRWESPAWVWLGVGLVVLASVLLGLDRGGVPGQVAVPPVAGDRRPDPSGLGVRVDAVLRLAEDQARDHIRSAEQEAERIVAEARRRTGQAPD